MRKRLNLSINISLIGLALCFIGVLGCSKKNLENPNILRQAVEAKISTLDPALVTDMYAHVEVMRAYEGLLEYHYLKRPYTLVPALAESLPQVSQDAKTYTFKIKSGVLFQDDPCFKETGGRGREVVAQDFVYVFKRLADPKLVSPNWWLLDGKIVGLNEWREEESKKTNEPINYLKEVEGIKALDRYTLQIKLKEPSYQFQYALAMSALTVVPKEAVEHYGKEFMNHPVGTGPFRIKEYNSAQRLVWEKNPTFRKEVYPSEGETGDKELGLLEDAGKLIPFIDGIVVQIMVEEQPRWLSFLSGKLDVSGVPKDNYAQAIGPGKELAPELKAKGIQLRTMSGIDLTRYAFNMKDSVVGKNRTLRQALSLAFDIDPMIELFYNGRAIAAQTIIPPGLEGYDPDYKNPYRKHNLVRAKEFLAKAGYPNGEGLRPIEFITYEGTGSRQMDEYLSKNFEKIGVKLHVTSYTWPKFVENVKLGKGQMWGMAWGADYPDAENFLQLLYGPNASPGPNDSQYSNPEYDLLYRQALKLPPGLQRTEIYKKMAKIAAEDVPWILGVHRIGYTLAHPWVKNVKPAEKSILANGSKYIRLIQKRESR